MLCKKYQIERANFVVYSSSYCFFFQYKKNLNLIKTKNYSSKNAITPYCHLNKVCSAYFILFGLPCKQILLSQDRGVDLALLCKIYDDIIQAMSQFGSPSLIAIGTCPKVAGGSPEQFSKCFQPSR